MKTSKRILSLLIAVLMLLSSFPSSAFASSDFDSKSKKVEATFTQEQREAFKLIDRTVRQSGLIGFESSWDLDNFDDDEKISVIVEFIHQPAILQQIQAHLEGKSISLSEANDIVQSDHELFVDEMNILFNVDPLKRSAVTEYSITATYTDAINGAAVTLPADKVKELISLNSVYAVYPDDIVYTEPVRYEINSEDEGVSFPAGMADTREYLGIDDLHADGIKGKGIVVGILDTGVDYNHPDLIDAFSNQYNGMDEDMRDNGKINGKYYGRNFVSYEDAGFEGVEERSPYNPMETTYAEWFNSKEINPEIASNGNSFYTSHGTHVSGTIAGRGVNEPISALGMAPEANLLLYRVLGPYGSGQTSWILSALDKVAIDGCDVVNMSLGAAVNNPMYATSLAVNNLIAQYDIVFAISAGNSGPMSSTLGSPGTSSLAITVGNGTVNSYERTVDIYAIYEEVIEEVVAKDEEIAEEVVEEDEEIIEETETIDEETIEETEAIEEIVEQTEQPVYASDEEISKVEMRLLTSGYKSIVSEGDGTWSMIPDLDELDFILIQGESEVEINGVMIGFGTEDEFRAMGEAVEGKIAVVYRGQAFVETAEIAKQYGAAAVIVITNGEGFYYGFQDLNNKYVPLFLTEEKEGAINIIEAALKNNGKLATDNYAEELIAGGELNPSSSRGPVGLTMDIKPDIVGPGTQVLSTVPYWETNAENKIDPSASGAYDYAYLHYTGTSMSSPHIAGIAALLLGEHPDWSSTQVKAHMMNTADPMNGYSVHEVGTGYVNPKKALDAKSYFTVDYDKVFYPVDTEDDVRTKKIEISSLNFGAIPVGNGWEQQVELKMNIYNQGSSDKTYTISHKTNHIGFGVSNEGSMIASEEKWESAGLELKYDSIVTVEGNNSETITVSLTVGENVSNEHMGVYEGYLLIDGGDFVIPFSVSLVNNVFFNRTFINQPVLTTSGIEGVTPDGNFYYDPNKIHFEASYSSDLYFSLEQSVINMFVIFASNDLEDPWDEDKWIGEAGIYIDASAYNTNELYLYPDVIGPVYIKYDAESPGGYSVEALEPGHYKAIIMANTWMGVQLSQPMDFYVDNELPSLIINELVDDKIVYESDDIQKATITGNIYDLGLEYLGKNSIIYELYDSEDDYHSPNADQSLNAIFAKVPGVSEYIQADISWNGDFVLNLTGLNSSGTTEVQLYYLDSFSAAQFSTDPDSPKLSNGFNPNGPSLNSYYGYNFAFYGLNKGLKTITLEHQGAFVKINPSTAVLEAGESTQLSPVFSADAIEEGFTEIINWSSSNNEVATVSDSGLVTAIGSGSAIITATSNNVGGKSISGSAKVTVIGINDGVSIPTGVHLFLGSGEYEDYEVDLSNKENPVGDETFTYLNSWSSLKDRTTFPYYWEVMGEEEVDGVGDGYLTIASLYGIKTLEYSDNGYVDYTESKLIDYLNSELMEAFNESEAKIIPYFDVEVNGELLENQRAYIPWGVDTDSDESLAGRVFWSSKNTKEYKNSFKGSSEYRNLVRCRDIGNLKYSTYYLKNSDDINGKIRVVNGGTGEVETRTDWEFLGKGYNWNNEYRNYEKVEIGIGVRPITKIDMSSVVYAYPFKSDGGLNIIATDAEGYVYGKMVMLEDGYQMEDMYMFYDYNYIAYKLSILGGNEGADIGRLSGIPSGKQTIEAGQKVIIKDLISSEYGDDYKIAYKIVGDVNGERKIVKYGEAKSSLSAQELELYTNELDSGEYNVYIWLQKYNERNSYEAGVVEKFSLEVKPVEIPNGVNDGVNIPADGYIYYGAYKHATAIEGTEEEGYKAIAWENKETPILWKVMGEEKIDDNNTDGYLSLMSKYVLDTSIYSASSSSWGSASPYENTTINLFLNRKLSNSFTNAEYNSIPLFTVSRADYIVDDEEPSPYADTNSTPNQKLYLPWAMRYTMNEEEGFFANSGRGVFWSASLENSIMENTIFGKYDENAKIPESIYGILKNGEEASYWLGASTAKGINYLNKDGTFNHFYFLGVPSQRNEGIRPITKLDLDGVVYAKEIGVDMESDDVNYITPKNGERYYKLTVIGTHGGKDIGELTGVPAVINSNRGDNSQLYSISSSNYGDDYSIAYKIVGTVNGERVIVKYGEVESSASSQRIKLETSDLKEGDYQLYTWLQKNNDVESNEAGIVYTTQLKIASSEIIIDENEDGKGKEVGKEVEKEIVFKHKFTDVPSGIWYEKAVDYVTEKGIFKGYSETTFGPNDNITRSQFVTLVGRLAEIMGIKTEGYTSTFKDVQSGAYYVEYIAWAESNGIISGYDEITFGVNDHITREQMATILARFVEYMNIDLGVENAMEFTDRESISIWAQESVNAISSTGLMIGSDGKFYPQRNTTRAEAAQVLMNFMEKYVK